MSNTTGLKQVTDNINTAEEVASNVVKGATENVDGNREQVSEKLAGLQNKVSDNLHGLAEKVHDKSDSAQDYLLEKSDRANAYAHQTIEAANSFGHRAADALDASSGYVKNFDLADTRQRAMESIKQRPEVSIAVAGVFGLLIGLLIGRSSK